MKIHLMTLASLAVVFALSACDRSNNSDTSAVACHSGKEGTSEYKDFYQMVAAGSDCNDLYWMADHCATDPSGSWIGNAGPGVCGDAAKSCRYAVASRNQTLGCWQTDQTPGC